MHNAELKNALVQGNVRLARSAAQASGDDRRPMHQTRTNTFGEVTKISIYRRINSNHCAPAPKLKRLRTNKRNFLNRAKVCPQTHDLPPTQRSTQMIVPKWRAGLLATKRGAMLELRLG